MHDDPSYVMLELGIFWLRTFGEPEPNMYEIRPESIRQSVRGCSLRLSNDEPSIGDEESLREVGAGDLVTTSLERQASSPIRDDKALRLTWKLTSSVFPDLCTMA